MIASPKKGQRQVQGFHFGIQSVVLARRDGDRLVPVT